MEQLSDSLETLWDHLLSRQADLIQAAYAGLALHEQQAVLSHLKRMSSEPGWHPEQRLSALAALEAIDEIDR